MFRFKRSWLIIAFMGFAWFGFGQIQDKEQSKVMVELAGEMLKASQAEDDVRDIMVQAAELDTTNIVANFEAGRLHLRTIKKEQAVRYLLRVYRQQPSFRFDLEYHIGSSYQYGLNFAKAIEFYNKYKIKFQRQPNYQGRDKVSLREIDRKIYECNNGIEFVANPKPFAIVNIGPQINSEFDDYGPVLNEKEDEIIFTSRRRDGNINEDVANDNKPFEDIFIANQVNGKWVRAKNIGKTVNIPNHNSNLALSADGKTLYTYKDDNGGDIFISELKPDNTWSAPKLLPGISSPAYEGSMSVSHDGNTLYFASDRPGGFGGLDIYMATKDKRGNWSNIKNLGPIINTERHDDSPFIDYTGKKLYFSSQAHKGMGGYDIFSSTLLNPGKNEWSVPENIGYPINTPDNDIYYVIGADGNHGYYASVREDGLGYQDVYVISPKEQVKTPTSVFPVRLVVKVIDAKFNTPLDATIELLSESDSKPVGISQQRKGFYTFIVTTKDPKIFRLTVKHDGYFPQTEEITLQSATMVEKTVSRTVGMAKSAKVAVIVPMKFTVNVIDGKTKAPLEAETKLESLPDNFAITPTPKGGGVFEYNIITPNAKTYRLTVDMPGYSQQVETFSLEGAGTVEKALSRTVSLGIKLASVIKYTVNVVEAGTNKPLEADVILEGLPEGATFIGTPKASGSFEYSLPLTPGKDFKVTAEMKGYQTQSQTVKADLNSNSITISLAPVTVVKKEPVIIPLKYVIKVLDEKTNQPLDANLKLETEGEATKTGITIKATGSFEFSIASTSSKEYTITAEKVGYVLKSEKVTIEGAGEAAKTLTKTITLVEVKKEPVIIPLKYVVKILDEKTNQPLDANLKLESTGEASKTGTTTKANGSFEFSISSTATKEYTLTAEKAGYVLKSEKVTIEGAGEIAKTLTKTITLVEVKKEPVIIPFKYVVKVLDEKTNEPLDANLKLEATGETVKTGTTTRTTGSFEFSIASTSSKEYTITAEKAGYVLKSEKVTIEGAGETAKTLTKTITLVEVKKEPVIISLKYVVKILDEKTNQPLEANLKLESTGDATKTGITTKATGSFEFSIASTASKEYTITAEKAGYVLKSEKVTIEGGGETAKTLTKTITMAELKKEPVIKPLKYVVKVFDEKNNQPLDANVKLEIEGEAIQTGTTIKTTGSFEFSIASTSPKEYTLSAEKAGYVLKVEKVTIEGAGETAKTLTKTITLAEMKKEPIIIPLKYVIKVLDEKTNQPLEANLKLESTGEAVKTGTTIKTTGSFEFSIASTSSKEYTITAEKAGYVLKSEKVTIEGAGETAKTLSKTITLAEVKKEPVIIPLKYVVKVLDEKTNQPLDANLKLEATGEVAKIGTTIKTTGSFEFSIASSSSKEYTITAEKAGYVLKSEKVTIEGAGETAKILTKTITLVEVKKEPVIIPLKYVVKVLDEKTNQPLEANLKLETQGEVKTGLTAKASGSFEFSLSSSSSKEYTVTVERTGYILKSEKVTIEGAGEKVKTLTKTIILAEIKKEPVIVPLKYVVKVIDEKTKQPLEANLKLESTEGTSVTGTTTKPTGSFSFSITSTSSQEYTITAEKSGYTVKSEKVTIEGAAEKVKTLNKTISLQLIPVEVKIAGVKLIVKVIDDKTKLPLNANVVLQSSGDNKKLEGVAKGEGVYEFYSIATTAKDYKLSADKEGYVYLAQQVRIKGATEKEETVNRTLSLQPISVGVRSILRNLYFDTGKATIKDESIPELTGFENMMKQSPTIKVEISGHTDAVGDNTYNKNLSQQRANAVKAWLVKNGVNATRIIAVGYGETRPLVSNDDEEGGREINRRVELKILSK